MPDTAVITGGTGFIGRKLSKALLAGGEFSLVVLYDIQSPKAALLPGEQYIQGATQDQQCFQKCLLQHSPVSVVFHVATYGTSGACSLDKKKTWEVNVLGTRCVILACAAAAVPRLVYTSTCNVVFGGEAIKGGDETMHYIDPKKQVDCYSSSKTIAEITVLRANGTPLAGGAAKDRESAQPPPQQQQLKLLHTCALRPNDVWGAGETHLATRLLSMADKNWQVAAAGLGEAVQDWTHIDNLVQAQALAATALTAEKHFVAAGEAYFITDGQPFNSTTFIKPLLEGLGRPMPNRRLPYWRMYWLAYASEWAYALLPRRLGFQPLFTRNEVRKAAVTHFFSCDRAKNQLGYKPEQRSVTEYLPWLLERGYGAGKQADARQGAANSKQHQRQQPRAAATAAAANGRRNRSGSSSKAE
ncbi:NAD(P) dependent steroid dehydrogenase-like protein [Scenedesmus sp. NREL 46B-D3]|nr:NAD(P) dependent steroid dehydrogenase-like protein [Scenedesmus sp. NREL 46B-D3]